MSDKREVCPSCSIELPKSVPGSELTSCPGCQHPLITVAGKPAVAREENETDMADAIVDEVATDDQKRTELRRKLPPKFLVDDPDFQGYQDQEKVLLPDGKGGITSVKRNVVKVQHKGQTIELIALTPQQRRRRQLIWNCVWIGIGILFLWLILSMI